MILTSLHQIKRLRKGGIKNDKSRKIMRSIGIEQMIRDYAGRYYDIEGWLKRNFCDVCIDKMNNESPCDLDTAIQKNCPFGLFCLNDDEVTDMWLNSEKEDD